MLSLICMTSLVLSSIHVSLSHSGGGVMGAAGWNSALKVLADFKRLWSWPSVGNIIFQWDVLMKRQISVVNIVCGYSVFLTLPKCPCSKMFHVIFSEMLNKKNSYNKYTLVRVALYLLFWQEWKWVVRDWSTACSVDSAVV